MKTQITLRSTFSNTSWFQRGAVALLVVTFIFALALILLPNTQRPAAAPAAQQSAPAARNPNRPVMGTGSAYDGQSHQRAQAAAPRAMYSSPIQRAASSAYDGQTHRSAHSVAVSASPALISTGSAYDGRTNVVVRPAGGNSPIRTAANSAYDGQSYRSAPATAPFVRDIPALHSTGSAYGGQ